jgi:hypothetical protein
MAGPGQRAVSQVRIQSGQAQVQYAPTNLAYKIKNLELTPEGTLRAIRGSCSYEPDRGGDQYGNLLNDLANGFDLFARVQSEEDAVTIYGVFHAGLLRGKAPTLLARAGDRLYIHAGWRRSWKEIYRGLTDDGRAGHPDTFTVVNDTIVWTNGIDPALVISYHGMVVPLGFDKAPGVPEAMGPLQPGDITKDYSNQDGYTWAGRIGTIGDFVDNNDGAVLAGRWKYATAYEDVHGNISPLSGESVEISIVLQRANAFIEEELIRDAGDSYTIGAVRKVDQSTLVDNLPRQFVVKGSGDAPEHAIATRLYRTPDGNRFPGTYRLVTRMAGTKNFVYADNIPDSRLGEPAKNYLPVPRFGIMTSHAGALVIAEGPNVLRSEVGFPGTFPAEFATTPDPDGAVVTGLASHRGQLIAFTERSMVDITDPTRPPVVMARGIGCVAPRSIQGLPDGTLIWLSRDAFYGWNPNNGVVRLSDPIHRLVKTELATGSLRNAVSVIEPESRDYRCAVARAGSFDNELLLAFDGQGWRELDLGYKIKDMCVTDDSRYLTLFAGGSRVIPAGGPAFVREGQNQQPTRVADVLSYDVYVMSRETNAQPPKEFKYEFQSAWLRGDDNALQPIHVHNLYIGMIDEINETIDVEIYANGLFAPDPDSPRRLKTIGVKAEDLLGDLTLGSGKTHSRRLFWRRVPVGLSSVNTWAFKLKSTTPFHIASFAFQTSFATMGDQLARIPLGEDE